MIDKEMGSVAFRLKEDFDFAFIRDYGRPFAVFDQQDSGNLCFGVERGGEKLFLKMAGAHTERMQITPRQAASRLRSTARTYEDLHHPLLIPLLAHREIPGGYLQVFSWFDGVCMGKQYGKYDDFLAQPVPLKLPIYEAILDFHVHVAERGYVAIDFYDGCVMHDFTTRQTRICDIEFYQKSPYVNDMGRMWGSTRYMSPEEFTLGAAIDEVSNVFCMGAAAFVLFGGAMDRSRDRWTASAARYQVALKAVSERRDERYRSVGEYARAWNASI